MMADTVSRAHPLDNPMWSSLTTRHEHLATGGALARRYPPDYGPFIAVKEATAEAELEAVSLVAKGERICFGAVAPPLSLAWRLERHAPILQMVFEGPNSAGQAAGGVVRLGASDLPSMVELTELVYPDYFRPATAENGVFYGVFDDGCLVAMAGTRFTTDGFDRGHGGVHPSRPPGEGPRAATGRPAGRPHHL